MPQRASARGPIRVPYDRGVFIDYPFDAAFIRSTLDAIVFALSACDLIPRAALEVTDAGKPRIGIISNLIAACRLGIHDISRVELNDNFLPRFNISIELRLWLGAEHFGNIVQRRKLYLILDTKRFRDQQIISDIGGQDSFAYGGDPNLAIKHVCNFLQPAIPDDAAPLLGGAEIARRFDDFQSVLPLLCEHERIDVDALSFIDLARSARRWLIRTEIVE